MKKNTLALLCLCFLAALNLSACASWFPFYNYTFRDRPKYVSFNGHEHQPKFNGSLKVISYNIKHSKHINQAIDLIRNNPETANADIILLQEMTPDGISQIADALDYNYVFYPAILHPQLKKDFGNAILSKWPLSDDHKVILPPITHKTRQRIAVGATVTVKNRRIKVFSVHLGIFIRPDERKNLIKMIIDNIDDSFTYCIIGGDFNSFTKKDRWWINESFTKYNYRYVTKNIGWTYSQWYFLNRKAPLDHIYAKKHGHAPSR